jgi:hypothetical protein
MPELVEGRWQFSFTLLLVFFGKSTFFPKEYGRILEEHSKKCKTKVVKTGHFWTKKDKQRRIGIF